MQKKYVIELSGEEREELQAIVKGAGGKSRRERAQILLRADRLRPDGGWSDQRIAEAMEISRTRVERLRQRVVEQGLAQAVRGAYANQGRERKLDGAAEAQLIALCCGTPPAGQARWTLRLLADRLVELAVVGELAPVTVWRTLKKMNLSLGETSNGA
jgi:transposase